MIYKYRFKTEKELVSEYGVNWSSRLPYTNFVPDMYYLLGTELDKNTYSDKMDKNGRILFDYNDLRNFIIRIPTNSRYNDDWIIRGNDVIKELPNFVDYNIPRKLVYEGLNIDDYQIISVKCNNNEESIKTQEFLFKNGYKWRGDYTPILSYKNINFIIIRTDDKKLTFLLKDGDDTEESNLDYLMISYGSNPKYIGINNLTELMKLFKQFKPTIDYNTPRKLVYEKLNDNKKLDIYKYRRVIYVYKDNEDLIRVQKLAFDNGIFWNGDDRPVYYNISAKVIIFNNVGDEKYLTYNSLPNLLSRLDTQYNGDYLLITDYKELMKLFKVIIDYNKPRQLVYESTKIKKYGE